MTAYEHICRRLAEVTGYRPAREEGTGSAPPTTTTPQPVGEPGRQ